MRDEEAIFSEGWLVLILEILICLYCASAGVRLVGCAMVGVGTVRT